MPLGMNKHTPFTPTIRLLPPEPLAALERALSSATSVRERMSARAAYWQCIFAAEQRSEVRS